MPTNYRRETCDFEWPYQIFVLKCAAKLKTQQNNKQKADGSAKKIKRSQRKHKKIK